MDFRNFPGEVSRGTPLCSGHGAVPPIRVLVLDLISQRGLWVFDSIDAVMLSSDFESDKTDHCQNSNA